MTLEYLKYILPMRRRYQALGLRVDGKPRTGRWNRRPELAGLDPKEYHRRYMEQWRKTAY